MIIRYELFAQLKPKTWHVSKASVEILQNHAPGIVVSTGETQRHQISSLQQGIHRNQREREQDLRQGGIQVELTPQTRCI